MLTPSAQLLVDLGNAKKSTRQIFVQQMPPETYGIPGYYRASL